MDNRLEFYRKRLGELAYERLKVARQLEQIDKQVAAYEAALEAAEQIRRNAETEAAIAAAKEQKNERVS